MKVALINPGRLKKWAGCEPLNLGYIASFLEARGHAVNIFDELAGHDVLRMVREFRPDIAGLTAVTPLAKDAYRLAAGIKQMGIPAVMGGVHVRFMAEDALANGIDAVVRGPGELAMADIVENGITQNVVDGVLPHDLDELPSPSRHLFWRGYYKTPKFVPNYLFVPPGKLSARLISSRGCAYKCTFCHNSLGKKRIMFHSPDRVVDELEALVRDYGIRHVFFMDDNFLMKQKRVAELCERILSRGVRTQWAISATSNEVREELLPLLRRAGCRQIIFGFESGSQRILDVLEKHTKVEKNEFALRKAKEAGLLTQGYILVGNPTETQEDMRLSREFVRRNKRYLDSLLVSFVTPFPGTQIWEDMRARGLLPQPSEIDWEAVRYDRISFPVNQEVPPQVLQRHYFELLSIIPPKFSTIVFRFLSDPIGVLSTVAKTGIQPVLSTLKQSILRRKTASEERSVAIPEENHAAA